MPLEVDQALELGQDLLKKQTAKESHQKQSPQRWALVEKRIKKALNHPLSQENAKAAKAQALHPKRSKIMIRWEDPFI